MDIYLPIAQEPVNLFVLLGIGLSVGFLSGMLGVSGGFVSTPLLIFYGIPTSVAVGSQASPVAAAALVGALNKSGKKSVDYKMGSWLLLGGLLGSAAGVYVFDLLKSVGQIDFVVKVSYVLLLGSIGSLMLSESLRAILATRRGGRVVRKAGHHTWIHNLPFKSRFYRSGIYISVVPVVALGLIVGVLTVILGTGGAFMLVPAKVYLLRMRTNLAIGTSQFQMFMVACMATVMHAALDHSVDFLLALILVFGGVVGAQMGSNVGARLKAEQLRAALAILILAIAARLIFELTATPDSLYALAPH
jgi:uncharacterized membrane protein YfcA